MQGHPNQSRARSVRWSVMVLVAAAAMAFPPVAGAVNVTYDFTTGDQGWRVAQAAGSPSSAPVHSPAGGNPGGFISATDTGAETGCPAPGAPCEIIRFFSPGTPVPMAANYGGTVSFDYSVDIQPTRLGAINIDSADNSAPELRREFVVPPTAGFNRITLPLTEAGWDFCGGVPFTCAPATQQQFQTVLNTAIYVDLFSDVRNGTGETYALDNMTIAEPAQAVAPLPVVVPPTPAPPGAGKKAKCKKAKKGAAAAKKKCAKKPKKR